MKNTNPATFSCWNYYSWQHSRQVCLCLWQVCRQHCLQPRGSANTDVLKISWSSNTALALLCIYSCLLYSSRSCSLAAHLQTTDAKGRHQESAVQVTRASMARGCEVEELLYCYCKPCHRGDALEAVAHSCPK